MGTLGWIAALLICAAKKGIFVVRCSRTEQGVVNQEPNFDDLHGFIAGGSLSPQKTRILLLVAVSKTQNMAKIQQIFDEHYEHHIYSYIREHYQFKLFNYKKYRFIKLEVVDNFFITLTVYWQNVVCRGFLENHYKVNYLDHSG